METQLPGFIIAGLYKDSLVLIEEQFTPSTVPAIKQEQVTNKTGKAATAPSPASKKWFLGDNKKNVTILVNDAAAVYINDQWLATLTKLLVACKLNLTDVAIINAREKKSFEAIKTALEPAVCLMFDISTNDIGLPFSIPHYQIQEFGGCRFMTAPGITLSADKTTESINTEKRNLWNKLKNMFNI